jgi:hypothetical protein
MRIRLFSPKEIGVLDITERIGNCIVLEAYVGEVTVTEEFPNEVENKDTRLLTKFPLPIDQVIFFSLKDCSIERKNFSFEYNDFNDISGNIQSDKISRDVSKIKIIEAKTSDSEKQALPMRIGTRYKFKF